ncbi:hypothetical protein B5807_06053 [Epicoccum nigrum]|uniref:Uncharacterized protein n=1 Tax=Epicoccum nigrum TaxID=105696 RepID=A0A1Y2M083_EPING|nr:hypothetical protein B5807_06053 [Epicoccum nigrum]
MLLSQFPHDLGMNGEKHVHEGSRIRRCTRTCCDKRAYLCQYVLQKFWIHATLARFGPLPQIFLQNQVENDATLPLLQVDLVLSHIAEALLDGFGQHSIELALRSFPPADGQVLPHEIDGPELAHLPVSPSHLFPVPHHRAAMTHRLRTQRTSKRRRPNHIQRQALHVLFRLKVLAALRKPAHNGTKLHHIRAHHGPPLGHACDGKRRRKHLVHLLPLLAAGRDDVPLSDQRIDHLGLLHVLLVVALHGQVLCDVRVGDDADAGRQGPEVEVENSGQIVQVGHGRYGGLDVRVFGEEGKRIA